MEQNLTLFALSRTNSLTLLKTWLPWLRGTNGSDIIEIQMFLPHLIFKLFPNVLVAQYAK